MDVSGQFNGTVLYGERNLRAWAFNLNFYIKTSGGHSKSFLCTNVPPGSLGDLNGELGRVFPGPEGDWDTGNLEWIGGDGRCTLALTMVWKDGAYVRPFYRENIGTLQDFVISGAVGSSPQGYGWGPAVYHSFGRVVYCEFNPTSTKVMFQCADIFAMIADKGIAPEFYGTVCEPSERHFAVGFVVRHIPGRPATPDDFDKCKEVLGKLHECGVTLGGIMGANSFIVDAQGDVFLHEFSSASTPTTERERRAEMRDLRAALERPYFVSTTHQRAGEMLDKLLASPEGEQYDAESLKAAWADFKVTVTSNGNLIERNAFYELR